MTALSATYLSVSVSAETAGSVCSDRDSGIGSCSPTSTGPACVPEHKSVQKFCSTEDYLYAMKEDLAEWLNCLYDQELDVDNFFDKLDNGVLLCEHACHVQMLAEEYRDDDTLSSASSDYLSDQVDNHQSSKNIPLRDLSNSSKKFTKIPDKGPVYRKNVKRQSFQARDNIANFIQWCKNLGIPDVVLFETEDLVARKNEKSVVLAVLEVARRGARFGMLVPCLIQLEQEIDAEIKGETLPVPQQSTSILIQDEQPQMQKITCDMKSLDEMVRELVSQCTCMPEQFPVVRLAEGKYMVGENKTLIFVRILRNHVMVRVGGGWDTLEHYLNKHDPCRCGAKGGRRVSVTSGQQQQRPHSSRTNPARQSLPAETRCTPIRELMSSPTSTPRSSPSLFSEHNSSIATVSSSRDPRDYKHVTSSASTPVTPTQIRRSSTTCTMTNREGLQSPAAIRHTGSGNTKQRSVSAVARPAASTTIGRQSPLTTDRGSNNSTNTSIPPVRRKLSLDNIPTRKDNMSERSTTTAERNRLQGLEGTLSSIRQQSEKLQKQLQEDFSDDSSICSVTSPVEQQSSTPMSKSLDFSRLHEARRVASPGLDTSNKRKNSSNLGRDTKLLASKRDSCMRRDSTDSKSFTYSLPRRSQTPNVTNSNPPTNPQDIQRRSMTPQATLASSRTRSQPTTPTMRRREQNAPTSRDVTKTSATESTQTARSKTPSNMTSTLKERLTKYKQETQGKSSRARRSSENPPYGQVQQHQSNLAASRRKYPSLNSLDRKDFEPNLDNIEDIGGDEELYSQMEKMFQEFKEKERAKAEQEIARQSLEVELERRMRETAIADDPCVNQKDTRETLRERLRNRRASTTETLRKNSTGTAQQENQLRRRTESTPAQNQQANTRTAPNTPITQRRSASAAPSWRNKINASDLMRRSASGRSSSVTRSKTPDPPSSRKDQELRICKCCHLLSECLKDSKTDSKPRKDDDSTRPPTRIPGPRTASMSSSKSLSEVRRASSLQSLASTDCESICSDDSSKDSITSFDNEVKNIYNKKSVVEDVTSRSPRSRRMSAPTGDCNNIMLSALVTNRSTIMKEAPRAMSPVKALRMKHSFDSSLDS